MKVHMVQYLCPKRHCIMAGAYCDTESTEAECIKGLKAMMEKLGINPHCAICGSKDLTFEGRPTKFKTMAEAAPYFAETAVANALTRKLLDDAGITNDLNRESKPENN